MRGAPAALPIVFATFCAAFAQTQQDPAVQRGRVFAKTNCASCHSIGLAGESPLRIAPPFRDLHKRYPVENLAEALAEGISTGHPTMPEFKLDPDHINDLLSFLKSLEH